MQVQTPELRPCRRASGLTSSWSRPRCNVRFPSTPLPMTSDAPAAVGGRRPGLSRCLSCPAGAEPSPALLVPSAKRRSRKTSKDAGENKDGAAPASEEPGAKARGRGRKPSTKAKSGAFWGPARRHVGSATLLGCLHRDPAARLCGNADRKQAQVACGSFRG